MEHVSQDNLEWGLLVQELSQRARTSQGAERCMNLSADLSSIEVESSWQDLVSLRTVIGAGYRPPIGEVAELGAVFRGCEIGKIFAADELFEVLGFLKVVQAVAVFLADLRDRCICLERFYGEIIAAPELLRRLERSVDENGEVLDSASPELAKIRRSKIALRKNIEVQIKKMLTDHDLETYLQDKFFTLRSQKYVVPIRLDGRGRVKGTICDTSDSGQTLYIEPAAIRHLNEGLVDLELAEKIEVKKILQSLSYDLSLQVENLQRSYQGILDLDVTAAKAALAHDMDAHRARLKDTPVLNLLQARHPILQLQSQKPPIANNIPLQGAQTSLIISGPNAGGKTVVLKTVGLIHLMAKAGLLIPVDPDSELFLFKEIFVALGDPQSVEANLSTFSGHIMVLKPILERADSQSLVLLDELAAGTEPQTGSALGQAVLERLAQQQVLTLVTTHFDSLKTMAMNDLKFRNGSMEFLTSSVTPTYKLVLDVPGQSYGIEVAEQLGLMHSVVQRARQLRGTTGSELDQLIDSLNTAKHAAEEEKSAFAAKKLEMETQKARWHQERKSLEAVRHQAGQKVTAGIEERFAKMFQELDESLKALRKAKQEGAKSTEMKSGAQEGFDKARREIDQLKARFDKPAAETPGVPCELGDLKEGMRVFIVGLGREGVVSQISEGSAPLEVQAGHLKLRPHIKEIRLLEQTATSAKEAKKIPKARATAMPVRRDQSIPFTPQSTANTLDLRGMDVDQALDALWQKVDKAQRAGLSALLVIHGHGTDALKRAVRAALVNDRHYQLDFRQGQREEGGDGVTVIAL